MGRPLFATLLTTLALAAAAPRVAAAPPAAPAPIEGELFDAWIGRYQDLTVEGLARHLALTAAPDAPLPFKASKAEFYDHVAKALGLSAAAKARLAKDGVLLLPQDRPYSMAAALYELYTRDLPLLVTTDAVLDAMHRSFDAILADLEETTLRDRLRDALSAALYALPVLVKGQPSLGEAAMDLDLYLAVALNLLESEPTTPHLLMAPRLVSPDAVKAILAKVAALELENPDFNGKSTTLYGARRAVDWSQFKPRGHYARSERLSRYFRALMWLGRADTGFSLDAPRQLRAAALLALLLEDTGAQKQLTLVRDVVDLMVGRSDELTPADLAQVLRDHKLATPSALLGDAPMIRLAAALADAGLGQQRIRSQLVVSPPSSPTKVAPPPVFQLFGQRFILDSFILSKVVYDDILFRGVKQKRRMPTGLDVMAALGNDLAVTLLTPELTRWNYAANLATLRDVVAAYSAEHWQDSLYTLWLDALRTLNAAPTGKHVPAVMTRDAWRRKTLQTQLASWSQLRHDTILYAKQSYTASVGCLYPRGFVEPYPAFFAKLETFAKRAEARFAALGVDARYAAYFANFARTMATLRGLADKELAGQPFSATEEAFLKNTIKMTRSGGYVPTATWDGWYVNLVYGGAGEGATAATKWEPVIADVHTDPDAATVLEVGTGNVDFLVAVIDNGGDLAVHVGPAFSYYEFTHPAADRLTDEQWQEMLGSPGTTPARPAWMAPLVQPAG